MKAPKKPMIKSKDLGSPFKVFGLIEPILGMPIAFGKRLAGKRQRARKK